MKKIILFLGVISLCFQSFAQVDFRKETIYFLITSRFFDGDTTNSAPTEWSSYIKGVNNPNITDPKDVTWRGDFKGLIQKLDYIKGMGFTAIWITPIVQNRGPLDYHGYHGWDFMKVDSRLESPGATFQDLINAAHAKGMKIVLDIVTNHSGRFGIKDVAEIKYNTDPSKPWGQTSDGKPLPPNPNWAFDGITTNPDDNKIWSRANLAKMPAPYNQNLAAFNWPSTEAFVKTTDPNWFHQSGNGYAQGWDDTTNLYQRALADDCPDLNTGSKEVQDYMFNAYKRFIDMGVDAFRWDTWKHMNKQDIFALYDRFKAYKPDLFVFGEVAQKRFELHPVEEINPHWYTWRGATGTSAPAGVGVLDFYGEATFHKVFEDGESFGGVRDAARYDHLYSDPSILVTWLDNHDFGPHNDWNRRYGGSAENLAACMNFMFTWRGIPSVYYGTEQQFMKGAYTDIHDASGIQKSIDLTGRAYYGNAFETGQNHKMYKHLKKLNDIRRAIPALQSGRWAWSGNSPGNGVSFVRTLGDQKVAVGLAKDGDAGFSFSGLPNGIYRDAVTGREVTVSGGNLSFNVKSNSAGIYVLNGPGMIGESGVGYFEACVTGCATTPKLTISPIGDNYTEAVNVTMQANGGTGAITIRYTTDGSEPTISSAIYRGPLNVSVATTIRAIAFDANNKKSDLEAQRYTFVLPKPRVSITPAAGNYYNPITVTLKAENGKAPFSIYYTTNGNAPTTASSTYSSPINISNPTTVKAIAVDANNQVSDVKTANYTFDIPNPVITANPTGGNYPDGSVQVALQANSPRQPVTIRYTTDGTNPTLTSAVYTNNITLNGPQAKNLKYIGTDNEGRTSAVDSQRYSFDPIADIWIYFKKPADWGANARIHYWNALPTGSATATTWPGTLMTPVCANGGWWKFKFNGVTSINIIFTDGAGKQTADLIGVTKTGYYDKGWLTNIPDVERPTGKLTLSAISGVAPLTVNFNASGSVGCTQLSYFWDFGNGNSQQTGINATASQTYTNPGTYQMELVVQDQNDKRDTIKQTITVTSTANSMKVHFKRPANWTNVPRIYFWNTQPTVTAIPWPGAIMTDEGNGWWVYTIAGANCSNIIFNNNASPQSPDLTKCGECWYDNGWVSNPLPVKFTSIIAKAATKGINVVWTVAQEINVAKYTVERSVDGITFSTVGAVQANGKTSYQFNDINANSLNKHFYRIMSTDFDGSIGYSEVVVSSPNVNANKAKIIIYPNPVKSVIQLHNKQLANGIYRATVQDVTGKVIEVHNLVLSNEQTTSLKLNNTYQSGSYLLVIKDKSGNTVCIEKLQIDQ